MIVSDGRTLIDRERNAFCRVIIWNTGKELTTVPTGERVEKRHARQKAQAKRAGPHFLKFRDDPLYFVIILDHPWALRDLVVFSEKCQA